MARAKSAPSDSDESVRGATKSKKQNPVEEVADEEEDENGSEYEIEEVLDAKRGYFPDGHMGYFVKWKGYGPEENSWVDEVDAENAADLVEEFWKKNPNKKRPAGRKSVDKKSPVKARKSVQVDDSSDGGEVKTKKRGRKSTSKKAESEDDMEVDQVEAPAPKKAKKNQARSSVSKVTKAAKVRTESPEADDDEPIVGDMSKFQKMDNWEGLIRSVDTVERAANGSLVVYFTLNSGESVKESSSECKQRFPQKLLEFYENNLRWKSVDTDS